jgi:hypothetical protein
LWFTTLSELIYIASNDRMNNEYLIGKDMEGCGRGFLRYYPVICLERLRKTTENLTQFRVSEPRFELCTCRIWSRRANLSAATFVFVPWKHRDRPYSSYYILEVCLSAVTIGTKSEEAGSVVPFRRQDDNFSCGLKFPTREMTCLKQ